ncbi:MAG: hypothetical protein V8Q41_00810 [Anaerostipes hadrus]
MITFILGEDRHVKYFVHSIGKYEYFAVKEAQFSLIYNGKKKRFLENARLKRRKKSMAII